MAMDDEFLAPIQAQWERSVAELNIADPSDEEVWEVWVSVPRQELHLAHFGRCGQTHLPMMQARLLVM